MLSFFVVFRGCGASWKISRCEVSVQKVTVNVGSWV